MNQRYNLYRRYIKALITTLKFFLKPGFLKPIFGKIFSKPSCYSFQFSYFFFHPTWKVLVIVSLTLALNLGFNLTLTLTLTLSSTFDHFFTIPFLIWTKLHWVKSISKEVWFYQNLASKSHYKPSSMALWEESLNYPLICFKINKRKVLRA